MGFEHRREVRFSRVAARTENGEQLADLTFTTALGQPLTLTISKGDLDWLLAWGRKALDDLNEGQRDG